MTEHAKIEMNPKVRFGRPTIRGTRITVEDVLRLASRGLSTMEIIEQYPRLTEADIRAAQEYAADVVRDAFVTSNEAAE